MHLFLPPSYRYYEIQWTIYHANMYINYQNSLIFNAAMDMLYCYAHILLTRLMLMLMRMILHDG